MKLTRLHMYVIVIGLALLTLPNVAKSQDAAKPADETQNPRIPRPRVQEGPPPVSDEEKALRTTFKTVPIAAIKDISVDNNGAIEFTAEGTTYIMYMGDETSRIVPAMAFLEQMRKARAIMFLSRAFDRPMDSGNADVKDKRNIFRSKLVFDTLKPAP